MKINLYHLDQLISARKFYAGVRVSHLMSGCRFALGLRNLLFNQHCGLVSWGCPDRVPQTGSMETTEIIVSQGDG